MRRASILAVMTTALALGVGPAYAQSGSGAAPSGTSGTGSGQSNPTGGQAGTSGAGSATSVSGGGQSATSDDEMSQPPRNAQSEFVQKAALANMAEIQLGQLALQNAQDPQVKQYAQTMVDEHTKALSSLRAAAGSVSLPTTIDKKHQKVHDKLSKLQGAEFDRAYMDAMVDAHEDTEKLLKKRVGDDASDRTARSESGTPGAVGTSGSTSSTTDDDASATGAATGEPASIDEWAAATLPKVRSHLEQARSLEDQVKQAERPSSGTSTPGTDMPGPGSSSPGSPNPGSSNPGSSPTPPQR